ncbi:transmembrane emp24 domain-containing protein p24delta3-like [Curcuma longa]|uniref:transmembrane emp24 domain-containing protein p24delta3-like n=1 Tax=Curcuma longa TaxID=136217 RepID=UPI003D9F799A
MRTRGEAIPPTGAMLLCSALILIEWSHSSAALWLSLPPHTMKCVSEDIHAGVVAMADYAIAHEGDPQTAPSVTVKVTSPNGDILHHKENVTAGHFGFTANDPGNYPACFWLDPHHSGRTGTSVSINWKIGIATKDWGNIAKIEKIEGVELELRKLEEAVEVIHENLLYLRKREANMRDLSEKTNTRVATFSMLSLGVCIVASTLQLWHLKGFFLKKKLI